MVEEPLKIYHTTEAYYLDHLRSLCARAETPTSLVEGKSLDEHACYVRHRISEKGKLLLDQIHRLQCYASNLCEIHDCTCCSYLAQPRFQPSTCFHTLFFQTFQPSRNT